MNCIVLQHTALTKTKQDQRKYAFPCWQYQSTLQNCSLDAFFPSICYFFKLILQTYMIILEIIFWPGEWSVFALHRCFVAMFMIMKRRTNDLADAVSLSTTCLSTQQPFVLVPTKTLKQEGKHTMIRWYTWTSVEWIDMFGSISSISP